MASVPRVREALEMFLDGAELTGQAAVRAEIARKLASDLELADPQTSTALARGLEAAIAGIMSHDDEVHDDWTTRAAGSGAAPGGDAPGS